MDWADLHLQWMEAGGDPERFWTVTPRQASREMQAMAARRRHDQNQFGWLAWHIEALARTKKLPPLKDMMGAPRKPRPPQDPEIMIANIKMAFGYPGEVKP